MPLASSLTSSAPSYATATPASVPQTLASSTTNPEFTRNLITDQGEVTNEYTVEFPKTYMAEFHQSVVRVYTALPRDT